MLFRLLMILYLPDTVLVISKVASRELCRWSMLIFTSPSLEYHPWAFLTWNRASWLSSYNLCLWNEAPMKLMPKYLDIMAVSYNRLPSTSQAVGEIASCHILMLWKFLMLWDVMISSLPRLQFSLQWLLVVLSYILSTVWISSRKTCYKKVIGSITMPQSKVAS